MRPLDEPVATRFRDAEYMMAVRLPVLGDIGDD